MKPTDTWIPIVLQKDDIKVYIYRQYRKQSDSIMYLVQCFRHSHRHRYYRKNLGADQQEAQKLIDQLSKGEEMLAKVTLKELGYYQMCESALNGVPLHVAVAFYNNAHVKPQKPRSVKKV